MNGELSWCQRKRAVENGDAIFAPSVFPHLRETSFCSSVNAVPETIYGSAKQYTCTSSRLPENSSAPHPTLHLLPCKNPWVVERPCRVFGMISTPQACHRWYCQVVLKRVLKTRPVLATQHQRLCNNSMGIEEPCSGLNTTTSGGPVR